MQIVLQQVFPLGRFHATPWRANPFDDRYGEWPPSPWRLVRALVARWYQYTREAMPQPDMLELEALVGALCTSRYCFYLPANARKGSPVRQYHPVEFGMDPPNFKAYSAEFKLPTDGISDVLSKTLTDVGVQESALRGSRLFVRVEKPKAKKKVESLLGKPLNGWIGLRPEPGLRDHSTSLVQDNYWCTPPADEGAIWWFLDGDRWTEPLIVVLDHCIDRIIYFGRCESFTRIRRVSKLPPPPNCNLIAHRISNSVPVLVPSPDARRDDVERITDDPESMRRSIPPGSRMMYAVRPTRPPAREAPEARFIQTGCRLVQFAIGFNVPPEPRAVVRLTTRFRSAVLRELLRIKTGDATQNWSRVDASIRESVAAMFGKDADGKPLAGHQHAEFLAWCEGGVPVRLLVWRDGRSFDEDEQMAILRAASRRVSWAAAGPDADEWKATMIPLDQAVPAPPGFEGTRSSVWESLTPYVPPRHQLRGAKSRDRESLAAQVHRELELRGHSNADMVEAEQIGDAAWVAVHIPRRPQGGRAFLGDRRGYWLRLTFPEPVSGPIRLGHSASFGLGLFRPATKK